jgi:hypothetical protein
MQNLLTDPEVYQGWKDSPQTQAYLQILNQRRLYLMEEWARGRMTTPEQQAQAVLLTQLADLSHETAMTMLESKVSDE